MYSVAATITSSVENGSVVPSTSSDSSSSTTPGGEGIPPGGMPLAVSRPTAIHLNSQNIYGGYESSLLSGVVIVSNFPSSSHEMCSPMTSTPLSVSADALSSSYLASSPYYLDTTYPGASNSSLFNGYSPYGIPLLMQLPQHPQEQPPFPFLQQHGDFSQFSIPSLAYPSAGHPSLVPPPSSLRGVPLDARGGLSSSSSVPFMGVRRPSGRKPREAEMYDDGTDPEEVDKKLKRRQRNKEAAARCRQRRVELMTSLQGEVDKYRRMNRDKEIELNKMKRDLQSLEVFMRQHECKMSESERAEILARFPTARPAALGRPLQQQPPPLMQPHPPGVSSGCVITPQAASIFRSSTSSSSIASSSISAAPLPGTIKREPSNDEYTPMFDMRKRRHNDAPGNENDVFERPKMAKMEEPMNADNQTLTQAVLGISDLQRPDQLKLDQPSSEVNSGELATPSNFGYPQSATGTGYTPFLGNTFGSSGGSNNILNQPTGLTPVTNQGNLAAFSGMSTTPLQNNDLRSL